MVTAKGSFVGTGGELTGRECAGDEKDEKGGEEELILEELNLRVRVNEPERLLAATVGLLVAGGPCFIIYSLSKALNTLSV